MSEALQNVDFDRARALCPYLGGLAQEKAWAVYSGEEQSDFDFLEHLGEMVSQGSETENALQAAEIASISTERVPEVEKAIDITTDNLTVVHEPSKSNEHMQNTQLTIPPEQQPTEIVTKSKDVFEESLEFWRAEESQRHLEEIRSSIESSYIKEDENTAQATKPLESKESKIAYVETKATTLPESIPKTEIESVTVPRAQEIKPKIQIATKVKQESEPAQPLVLETEFVPKEVEVVAPLEQDNFVKADDEAYYLQPEEADDVIEHIMGDYNLFEEDEVISLRELIDYSQAEISEDGQLIDTELEAPEEEFILPALVEVPATLIEELPAPVEEVEMALLQLSEVMDPGKPEISEKKQDKMHAILNEIITLPDKIEMDGEKVEVTIDKKLEELFVELFEEAEIEYSPELLQSMIKLTRAHYLDELIEDVKPEEITENKLPDEIGTREFLQKIHHGLSAMKRAAFYFAEIGKSVLKLYGMNGAMSQPVLS